MRKAVKQTRLQFILASEYMRTPCLMDDDCLLRQNLFMFGKLDWVAEPDALSPWREGEHADPQRTHLMLGVAALSATRRTTASATSTCPDKRTAEGLCTWLLALSAGPLKQDSSAASYCPLLACICTQPGV